jgi:small ligand-binding sensory domain FIST
MRQAGLERAGSVFIFMSHDMAGCLPEALKLAARTASTLQVHGCTTSGVFSQSGWSLEQSAVAVLVIEQIKPLSNGDNTRLCLSASSTLPSGWETGKQRYGLLDNEACIWRNSRRADISQIEISMDGFNCHASVSTGLQAISEAFSIDSASGHQLHSINGRPAIENLLRALPAEYRARPPLHRIYAVRQDNSPGVAVLSINADGSLTLSACLQPEEKFHWCIRQSLSTERAMHAAMEAAKSRMPQADFALMFSCLGRGPLFYGEDDLDLCALRDHYPDLPLIGAYGKGQIATLGDRNLLYQNTAITLFFKAHHV